MNQCDRNTSTENLCVSPPFALEENISSPKEYDKYDVFKNFPKCDSTSHGSQPEKMCEKLNSNQSIQNCSTVTSSLQNSSPFTPPDLVESITTDGTSCCSIPNASDSVVIKSLNSQLQTLSPTSPSNMSSTQTSSFFSATSFKDIVIDSDASKHVSRMDIIYPIESENIGGHSQTFDGPHIVISQTEDIGFSELMREADDTIMQLQQSHDTMVSCSERKSNARLSPLLENQEWESGALISAAPNNSPVVVTAVTDRIRKDQKWWHNIPFLGFGQNIDNQDLNAPLLTVATDMNSNGAASNQPDVTRLLSGNTFQRHHINSAFDRAIASVETKIESDDSFEVSFLLGENSRYTVEDVMEIISNTDLLSLWCDPIETLIVTSNSSHTASSGFSVGETRNNIESDDFHDESERTREYEGEWVEATTSALQSPSSSFSFILDIGQSILESFGCTSYGRIVMFAERRRGHVGLKVGPFHGGIYASHSIYVSMEDTDSQGGRIRIVDRVRLTHDDDYAEVYSIAKLFGCSVASCLGQCFLPSIKGYLGQVTTSMAQLRILLENEENKASSNHPPSYKQPTIIPLCSQRMQ